MPKFRVDLQRVEYMTAEIVVEAESELAAYDEAMSQVADGDWTVENAEQSVTFVESEDETADEPLREIDLGGSD